MTTPFVTVIPTHLYEQLKNWFNDHKFQFTYPAVALFQAKSNVKHVCCTLYASGKLVVQGKGAQEFVSFDLEPEFLFKHAITTPSLSEDSSSLNLSLRIGTDESGKGDFFGPLCIAGAVPKTEQDLRNLYETEIRDSKTIKNTKIFTLSKEIRRYCFTDCIILYPEKYNALYQQFQNLNHLLAWGHATVIHHLTSKSPHVAIAIADQFSKSKFTLLSALRKKNKTIHLIQRTHAENDIVVAAASILAREAFLLTMRKLEDQYHVQLPLGASQTVKDTARNILQSQGVQILSQLCKTHFKTFQEVQ